MPSSEVKPTTPKVTTPQAPAVVPETPKQPRGILKQNDFSQKKRRVVFAGSDGPHSSSSEDDGENVLKLTKVMAFKECSCLDLLNFYFELTQKL